MIYSEKELEFYLTCTRNDFRKALRPKRFIYQKDTILGKPGMSLEEAIAHEGDTDNITRRYDNLIFVDRPSSSGPLRPEWLSGVDYVARMQPDGRVFALPARELWDKDWEGRRCVDTYGIGR